MAVSDAYARMVNRVWKRIEDLTGHAPFYLDRCHIGSYCPRCLDGTVLWTFSENPKPRTFVSSQGGGPGACSHGCTAVEIVEAMS